MASDDPTDAQRQPSLSESQQGWNDHSTEPRGCVEKGECLSPHQGKCSVLLHTATSVLPLKCAFLSIQDLSLLSFGTWEMSILLKQALHCEVGTLLATTPKTASDCCPSPSFHFIRLILSSPSSHSAPWTDAASVHLYTLDRFSEMKPPHRNRRHQIQCGFTCRNVLKATENWARRLHL